MHHMFFIVLLTLSEFKIARKCSVPKIKFCMHVHKFLVPLKLQKNKKPPQKTSHKIDYKSKSKKRKRNKKK